MIEKLYTVEEVAELASVTGRTIRNYLKSGRLVGRKIGGQWRFPENEVQRLLSGADPEVPTEDGNPMDAAPTETDLYTESEFHAPAVELPPERPAAGPAVSLNPDYASFGAAAPSGPSVPSADPASHYVQTAPIPAQAPPVPQSSVPEEVYGYHNVQQNPAALVPHAEGATAVPTVATVPAGAAEATSTQNVADAPYHSSGMHAASGTVPAVNAFAPQEAGTPVFQPHEIPVPTQPAAQEPASGYAELSNVPAGTPAYAHYGQAYYPYPQPVYPGVPLQPGQAVPVSSAVPPTYWPQVPPGYQAPYSGQSYLYPPVAATPPAEPATPPPNPQESEPPQADNRQLPYTAMQSMEGTFRSPEAANETPSASDAVVADVVQSRTRVNSGAPDLAASKDVTDVGKRILQFVSEAHDCSHGPQICAIVDLHQSFNAAKITNERLADIAEQESDGIDVCQYYVEYDERYYVARYTLFGTSSFLLRCLKLIG